jgi:hypothetical protein
VGSSSELEEVILKLLKILKMIDLDDQQRGSSQQEVLNLYAWKTDLIDQICTQEVSISFPIFEIRCRCTKLSIISAS